MADFAAVDNKLAAANSAIGESSNLAQLALTYTYNYPDQKYLDAVNILAVLAQIAIDNAKRSFDIDLNAEIARLKKELDVENNGLPYFWFFIKRKGRFAKKVNRGSAMEKLNPSLVCPMNYICHIQVPKYRAINKAIPMEEFFIRHELEETRRKSQKVEKLIEKYSISVYSNKQNGEDALAFADEELEGLIEDIKSVYVSGTYKGLISWLIDRAFLITPMMKVNASKVSSTLYSNRPLLLKVLYNINPSAFLECFKKGNLNNTDQNQIQCTEISEDYVIE